MLATLLSFILILIFFVCLFVSAFVSLPPGPSPDGSDGRGTSDGSSANDLQPACSQTHQPLHTHARSPGQLAGVCAFIHAELDIFAADSSII